MLKWQSEYDVPWNLLTFLGVPSQKSLRNSVSNTLQNYTRKRVGPLPFVIITSDFLCFSV